MSGEISGYKRPVPASGTIVVDLGCASYPISSERMEDSVLTLIKRFEPDVYFGFDPVIPDGVGKLLGTDTVLLTSHKAAWTHEGREGYTLNGNCSHVGGDDVTVNCFDVAAFLKSLPKTETILKIDVEGAEYVLLPHLIANDALKNVSRILVEWHEGDYANGYEADRGEILAQISCPTEEWH